MQNLRKLNIFQLYRKIPYIIYKESYLFPQRPFPSTPLTLNQTFLDDSLIKNTAAFKKKPQIDKTYKRKLQAYFKKFIVPIEKSAETLKLELFVQQRGNQISLFQKVKIKDLDITALRKQFSNLSAKDQKDFEQKARLRFQAKFKIPKIIDLSPEQIYRLTQQNVKSPKEKIVKFANLAPSQKSKWKTQSKDLQMENQRRLQNFLLQHNLRIDEFQMILQISKKAQQYSELCKKLMKQEKKKIKMNLEENKEEDAQALVIEKVKNARYLEKMPEMQYERYEKIFQEWQLKYGKKQKAQVAKPRMKKIERNEISQIKIEQKRQTELTSQKTEEKPLTKQKATKKDTSSLRKQSSSKEKKLLKPKKQSKPKVSQKTSRVKLVKNVVKLPQIIPTELASIEKNSNPNAQKAQETSSTTQTSAKLAEQTQTLSPQHPVQSPSPPLSNSQVLSQLTSQAYTNILEDQLKEQDLNDLEILQQDYEVLKLNKLIEKAGKPRISVKKIN